MITNSMIISNVFDNIVFFIRFFKNINKKTNTQCTENAVSVCFSLNNCVKTTFTT